MCALPTAVYNIHGQHKQKIEEENNISELLFAGDQVLIAENEESLQNHLNAVNIKGEEYNMKMNIIKTETMTISRQPENLTIKLQNVDIKQTTEAKY